MRFQALLVGCLQDRNPILPSAQQAQNLNVIFSENDQVGFMDMNTVHPITGQS